MNTSASQTLTITRPDDWHLHVRDGAALQTVVPHTAAQFARAIIMPNLRPPVTTAAQALAYRERHGLLKRDDSGVEFPYPVSPETQSRGALASITGSSDIRWGSWGEATGGEEHAEPVVVAVAEASGQAPVELENVARSLGSTPAKALWSVTMRLAAPGAAAGAALVFLGVSNELTATLLLSPLGTRTLSTGFWALTSEIDYVAAAPYAMLMILISLPLTAILYMQSKKIAGL